MTWTKHIGPALREELRKHKGQRTIAIPVEDVDTLLSALETEEYWGPGQELPSYARDNGYVWLPEECFETRAPIRWTVIDIEEHVEPIRLIEEIRACADRLRAARGQK